MKIIAKLITHSLLIMQLLYAQDCSYVVFILTEFTYDFTHKDYLRRLHIEPRVWRELRWEALQERRREQQGLPKEGGLEPCREGRFRPSSRPASKGQVFKQNWLKK